MTRNRVSIFVLVTVTALVAIARGAGRDATEEAAIRKLITMYDQDVAAAPRLSDRVFWSNAYKRPVMGDEKGIPLPGSTSVPDRVPGSQRSKTEPIKIAIADSHDLAYEYSKSNLQFDMKSGQHVTFETGILRVWQKEGGEWKIAAMFSRPYAD
jgi:hypothetical protein